MTDLRKAASAALDSLSAWSGLRSMWTSDDQAVVDNLRAALATQQEPLTVMQIWALPELRGWFPHDHYRLEKVVRAVERAHGIGNKT
jgi:hypothetical protein